MQEPTASVQSLRSQLSLHVISCCSVSSSAAGPFWRWTVCHLLMVVHVSSEIHDHHLALIGSNCSGFTLWSRRVLSFRLPVISGVVVVAIFGIVEHCHAIWW